MNILLMMIPVTITIGLLFMLFFLSAVKGDQFEDLETPAHLPFSDDSEENRDDDVNKLKKNDNNRGEIASGKS